MSAADRFWAGERGVSSLEFRLRRQRNNTSNVSHRVVCTDETNRDQRFTYRALLYTVLSVSEVYTILLYTAPTSVLMVYCLLSVSYNCLDSDYPLWDVLGKVLSFSEIPDNGIYINPVVAANSAPFRMVNVQVP